MFIGFLILILDFSDFSELSKILIPEQPINYMDNLDPKKSELNDQYADNQAYL